jgi:CheY-like chemotaxis protein
VCVDAPEALLSLPAAVEVAAYRIVQEALMNVARHAHARTCTIRLALDEGQRVEVSDDGVGLPESYRAGVGLASMRERALELGSHCTIERQNGVGTRVQAWLPVAREEVDGAAAVCWLMNHPVFCHGLRTLLGETVDLAVVGEATTGEEAVRMAEQLQADAVLMDLRAPAGSRPAAGSCTPAPTSACWW